MTGFLVDDMIRLCRQIFAFLSEQGFPIAWRFGLLVLLAFQGPLSHCHCHGTLVNSSADAGPWLLPHLQSCHPAVDPTENLFLGWHLDLPLPGNSPEEPSPTQGELTQQAILVSAESSGVSHLVGWLSLLSPAFHPFNHSILLTDRLWAQNGSSTRSRHFFETYATTLALPLRFNVVLC